MLFSWFSYSNVFIMFNELFFFVCIEHCVIVKREFIMSVAENCLRLIQSS